MIKSFIPTLKVNLTHIAFFTIFFGFCCTLFSQSNHNNSQFNAHELFAQGFYNRAGDEYRAANGAPGPKYWQNSADYVLNASIDTTSNVLTATETLTYTNNSPNSLASVWLELAQNNYKEGARSNFYRAYSSNDHTNGFEFSKVSIELNGQQLKADYVITDTRMQIRLPENLKSGNSLKVNINYKYSIPGKFGGRNDYFSTQYGKIYEIAQWYPKMSVYDNLRGWSVIPFLGSGEFYSEYGDFDYTVTVPKGMIVAGSGELQNPEEVLSDTQRERLEKAQNSDNTVMIRTAAEVRNAKSSKDHSTKSWHFKMKNTRDVAFGASSAYIWDAARVNLPEGKKSLAMSVYPIESAGSDRWDRATEYLKKSIEYFSEKWFVYPYPVAINEAGKAGGMEYPGIVFDGMNAKGGSLYGVTAHEIGHNWFPMIVGSDERRYAWMDEGFNTFIDIYASDEFNNGEFAPKRDGEYAPKKGNPAEEILPLLQDKDAPSMMARADMLTEKYRHPLVYFKPAFGLVMLREQILGPDRFDYAFKKYIERWAYKHPSPEDFFRTMENEGGEDLTWFWNEWFYHNWELDLSVKEVTTSSENGKNQTKVTIANLDKMAMPFTLQINFADGSKEEMKIPVEAWLQGATHSFSIPGDKNVKSVVIDPENRLPDSNRENNRWEK